MLVSTFVKTMDQANTVSYSIILANIYIMIIFISTTATLKLFYSDDMMEYVYIRMVTTILEMFPSFCFAMSYGITTFEASKNFDYGDLNWREGHHFGWEEYEKHFDYTGELTGQIIISPTVGHFVRKIKMMTWVFFFAFIYFDHIISSNRGVSYSFFFPFLKSYWKTIFPRLFKEEVPIIDTTRLRRKVKKVT